MFLYQTLDPSRGCTEEQARFCDSHGKMDKLAPVMASSQYVVAMLAAGSLPCGHVVLAAPFFLHGLKVFFCQLIASLCNFMSHLVLLYAVQP